MVGDADDGNIALDFDPFVVFGVLEAHGVLLAVNRGQIPIVLK
jgi:hypothetical protein